VAKSVRAPEGRGFPPRRPRCAHHNYLKLLLRGLAAGLKAPPFRGDRYQGLLAKLKGGNSLSVIGEKFHECAGCEDICCLVAFRKETVGCAE